jgi:hypothetical protein
MAIKNSVAILMKSGMSIPANNVVVSAVHFPKPTPIYDDAGVYTGDVVRLITYDLLPYMTEADITTKGVDFVSGEMVNVPNGWSRQITPAEYTALIANGALAEVWLKDQFNIWLAGNVASIVNPF